MVNSVDQVWPSDITYIPLRNDFLCLVAIVNLIFRPYSAGDIPTASTQSSVWKPWGWPMKVAASH
jgi:hypothetical protein